MKAQDVRTAAGAAGTRLLSRLFAPKEHVLAFARIPSAPTWVPAEAKIDYLYWIATLRRLREDFQLEVGNLLEIGANFAQDAWFLARELNLADEQVAVVEPVPTCARTIKGNTGFHLYECAVSETEGSLELWVPVHDEGAWGMASLGVRHVGDADVFRPMEVDVRTAKSIADELAWERIDLVKIDVEGFSLEVLRSFGEALSRVQVIQVETERISLWSGQGTEEEVFDFLAGSGFVMVDYALAYDAVQADSLWVNAKSLHPRAFDRKSMAWKDV